MTLHLKRLWIFEFDTGFIRKHENRGKLVHVTQGANVSAELMIGP